jgi:uncharacterized protein (DUF433 family)
MAETLLRTPTKYPHIELDDKNRPVIAGTGFRVSMIVQDVYGANAYTPEQIVEHYPDLSLTQVHIALAYYHENKAEIDAAIDRERQFFEEVRRRNHDPERERKLIEGAHKLGLIRP